MGAGIEDASLKGALPGGIDVRLLDGLVGRETEGIVDLVLAARPDWLGLSVYAWSAQALGAVSRALRKRAPGLLIFAGGPEATADPEVLLEDAELDFLIRGEGESLAVKALAQVLAWEGAEGRAAREGSPEGGLAPELRAGLSGLQGLVIGGTGQAGAARAPLEDLSRLASPWLSGLLVPKEGGVLWELARGCPFHCSYCYEGKGEAALRRFPRPRIEAELDGFVKAGVEQVFVLDPTFDADREGARDLLDLIGRRGSGIHWKFEVRAELLDRDLARRFSRLDASLQIGLQTADPAVSAAVRRPLDLKAFSRGIGHLNAEGVIFGIDLIYGLPGDSLAGFRKSVDYALGLQPNHLDLFPLSVLPGTVLAEEAEGLGLVAQDRPPYALISTPGFSPEALSQAGRLARACDFFYSRGRAVSWLLQALRPLKARPSAFLGRFADWALAGGLSLDAGLEAGGPSSRDIEAAQRAFLGAEYGAKGLSGLLPALMDIVGFNAAWGRALAEGEASELRLSYDPDEVLGPGALDLAGFARSARPRPGLWTVEATARGPRLARAHGSGGPQRRA